MKIYYCQNFSKLLTELPRSVNDLTLDYSTGSNESECGKTRKFRKLKLLNCKNTLHILSRYAAESLTIDGECLLQPGVIEYLTQMDCKQITVRTFMLKCEQLIKFFSCKSKANKYIECSRINYSQIEQVEWAFKYFTQKCLNKEINIFIDEKIKNAKVIFETLFRGSLKDFQNKRIGGSANFNSNVCFKNPDTHTQSLYTNSLDLAVLALNNCRGLIKLQIFPNWYSYNQQKLVVEKLSLQELEIGCIDGALLSDILKKSKDTLHSFNNMRKSC
ncbi:hypothetical protein FGO68_gene11331 [Halteria grandinella]|uniref:Uncharacterized protein n=1 Tax=Halteria grandinella TaxID=5974 RepID=A0A8J8T3A4_HALGN|nr:hypothetical protein FGO68_gene11331 [Halteria grandinella]